MYAEAGAELRTMFARVQREAGAATSLDMRGIDPDSDAGRVDWLELLAATLSFIDVFAPSLDELAFMLDRALHERLQTGTVLVDQAVLAELAATLTALGGAVVAIKLGEQGLYMRTRRENARIRAFCDRVGIADAELWRDHEVLSPCFAPRACSARPAPVMPRSQGYSRRCCVARVPFRRPQARRPSERAASKQSMRPAAFHAGSTWHGGSAAAWHGCRATFPPPTGVASERDPTGTIVTLR